MSIKTGSISVLGLSEQANISLNTLRMKMELSAGFRCRLRNIRELCDLLKQSSKANNEDVREALSALCEKLDRKQRDYLASKGVELTAASHGDKELGYRGSRTHAVEGNSNENTDASVKKPSGRMYRGQPI